MYQAMFLSICIAALVPFNSLATTNYDADTHHSHTSAQKANMSGIDVILKDHDQIKKMVAKLEKSLSSDIKESRSQLKELKDFLVKHETMEQKVWYPELEKHDELKDILKKVKDEEEAASDELKKLDEITDDKEWKTKVQKLIKDVKNHAKDEESNLFPKVKKVVDKSSLEEVGKKMEDYKNKE